MEDITTDINGIQIKEPRLYDALRKLNGNVKELEKKIKDINTTIADIKTFVGMP